MEEKLYDEIYVFNIWESLKKYFWNVVKVVVKNISEIFKIDITFC